MLVHQRVAILCDCKFFRLVTSVAQNAVPDQITHPQIGCPQKKRLKHTNGTNPSHQMDFHKYWWTTTQKVDTLLLVPPPKHPISVYIRATCPSVDSSKWELPKIESTIKKSRAANLRFFFRPNFAESRGFPGSILQSLVFLCCFQSSNFFWSTLISDQEMMDAQWDQIMAPPRGC